MPRETKNESAFINSPRNDEEIHLLDFLGVLLKNKTLILGCMALVFLLACGITLLMPNIYTATTRILPPSAGKTPFAGLIEGMGDLGGLPGIAPAGSSADLYVGMLKSRSIADAIIDQHDLMEVYGQEYRDQMYATLEKIVNISVDRDSRIISLKVNNKDPELAAAIANAYVDELKMLNVQLNLTSAGRERVFLEDRLEVVRRTLVRAEENLQEFQKKHKAIRLDEQAAAVIDAVSRLRAELASKEVELGVLLTYQTEQNPQVRAVREEIGQIKSQLSSLENSPTGKTLSDDIFIATADVPDLGIRYARLMRDYKIQENLFELLTRQYEMAKISEAKNTASVQVLDPAVVPDRKSKPNRKFIVLVATFIAGLLAVAGVFSREAIRNLPEEEKARFRKVRKKS